MTSTKLKIQTHSGKWRINVLHTLTVYDCIVSRDEKLLKQLSPDYWKDVRLYKKTELSLRTYKTPYTSAWPQLSEVNKWQFIKPELFMKDFICKIRSHKA